MLLKLKLFFSVSIELFLIIIMFLFSWNQKNLNPYLKEIPQSISLHPFFYQSINNVEDYESIYEFNNSPYFIENKCELKINPQYEIKFYIFSVCVLKKNVFILNRKGFIPSLFIYSESNNFTGKTDGIFNFTNSELIPQNFFPAAQYNFLNFKRNNKSFIPVKFALIQGSNIVINENVKLRIKGSSSTLLSRPNFKLQFSKPESLYSFGTDSFEVTDFIIHSSSGDGYYSLIKNKLVNDLAISLGFPAPKSFFCNLYLNNSFWGIYHVYYHIDSSYLQKKLKANIKNKFIKEKDFGKTKNLKYNNLFFQTINSIDKSNTNGIDLEKFSHYFILQAFINNLDWPNNNVGFLIPENEVTNYKIQPFPYDFDATFFKTKHNPFFRLYNSKTLMGEIFTKLLSNENFVANIEATLLTNYEIDLLEKETIRLIEQYERVLHNQIIQHTKYWNPPLNETDWKVNLAEMKKFVKNRDLQLLNEFKSFKDMIK